MGYLPTITHARAERPAHWPVFHGLEKKKTALVCAGGGITGAVYEVGVLRALSACLPGYQVDIHVGVSAGAIVAALLANRVPSEELFNALAGCARSIDNFKRRDIYRLNVGEFLV